VQEEIESDLSLIHAGTDEHYANDRMGYLWSVLAVAYRRAGDFANSERAYIRSIDLQRDMPTAARNYATTLDNFGTLYLVYGRLDEAEHYNRMGAKMREKLGYKLDAARSEMHMAEIDLAKHRFKQAEHEAEESLAVMREEKDPEAADIITSLNALAFTHCLRGRCAEGLTAAREAVDLAGEKFGGGSMQVAHAQMALGFAAWKSGRLDEAEPLMRAAIDTMQRQPQPAGRSLLLALMEYRNYLRETSRDLDAATVDGQLTTATLRLNGECSACINARSLASK
jgi:Flp pilus assembly protein TadD